MLTDTKALVQTLENVLAFEWSYDLRRNLMKKSILSIFMLLILATPTFADANRSENKMSWLV